MTANKFYAMTITPDPNNPEHVRVAIITTAATAQGIINQHERDGAEKRKSEKPWKELCGRIDTVRNEDELRAVKVEAHRVFVQFRDRYEIEDPDGVARVREKFEAALAY